MNQIKNLHTQEVYEREEEELSQKDEMISGTLDGFSVKTRTKAILLLLDPIVVNPSYYIYMPQTDMLNGGRAICFKEDSPASSNADSRLSKVLKNDRLDE